MRVLQIHNHYRRPGGEDEVVAAEANLLSTAGHDVFQHLVANPNGTTKTVSALVRASWNKSSAQEISTIVKSYRPDVIHIHNTWFRLSPSVVATAHRLAPVVMTLHNYRLVCSNAQLLRNTKPCRLCVDGSLWNGVVHSCYRDPFSSGMAALTIATGRKRVWRSEVDVYLALSHFASTILSEAGVPRDRLALKDNFVPDPGYRSQQASQSRELLFVGRLSPEKGIKQLLAHKRLFKPAGLSLMVIGDGPLAADVRRSFGRNYLGRLDQKEICALMLRSRALLMPSLWYEGQPRAALEAFAAGLPVMGSPIGALMELLSEQSREWMFDPILEWQLAIERLRSDSFIAEGSKRARNLWELRFTPARAVSHLTDSYFRAIEVHGRHGTPQ
jgi:glycosyltransferase involved in cell wall biosynthesis